MNLEEEQLKITEMLGNKVLEKVLRHGESEVVLVFSDGTRFFVDANNDSLQFSITNGQRHED